MATRRLALALAVAGLTGSLLAAQPAHADAAMTIDAYQYFAVEGTSIALAGYIGTPAGPRRVTPGPVTRGLTTIVNRDPIPHTLVACVSSCDAPNPVYDGSVFSVSLDPLQGADIEGLFIGTQVFGCTRHPWMRGVLTVTG